MTDESLKIIPARQADIEILQKIQAAAFQEDVSRYPGRPDCPAFETAERIAEKCRRFSYYAFWLMDDLDPSLIVGGAEVRLSPDGISARIGRIYIDPAFQDRHLGRQAILAIESMHPDIRVWTLDTPYLNFRNHHFYEKLGYRKVGETVLDGGFVLFDYEKKIDCGRGADSGV